MPDNEVSKTPRRVMGFRDLFLFYVVTGISLRWIATAATAGASAVVIWLIAWFAFYLPLVMSVMELTSRYPQEGGMYVWTKRAFGDFSGFLGGWTYWVSNIPYFPAILYFAASCALYLGPPSWRHLAGNRAYFILFSLAGLLLGTALNIVGLNVGKWLHNLGAIGTWLPIGILYVIAAVAWHRFGSATSFRPANLIPHAHFRDLLFWATIVFALAGSESASFLGDEIENPRRNIPRALFCAGIVVTTGYILGTVAILIALPSNEVSGLEGIMQAISSAAGRIGLGGIIPIAALLIVVSNIGTLGAWLACTARIPFVAGIDRYLPPAFARLHPRWDTPYVSLITQSACAALFIFLGQAGTSVYGAYEVLVSMGIITYFIPYLYVFAALIRLQGEAAGPEVMRVPGGKPAAITLGVVGFTTTLISIALSVAPGADEPRPALAVLKIVGLTLILLAVGVAIFYLGNRRRHRDLALRAPLG
ncbi:MAG: APC family permease [Candidatus Acidiferrales bacterium]